MSYCENLHYLPDELRKSAKWNLVGAEVHATKNYKNTTKKSLQDHNQSSVYVFSFAVVSGVLESHGWSFCTHRHQKLGFFRQSRPLNGHLNVADKKLRGGVECEASQAVNLVRCEWKAAEKNSSTGYLTGSTRWIMSVIAGSSTNLSSQHHSWGYDFRPRLAAHLPVYQEETSHYTFTP